MTSLRRHPLTGEPILYAPDRAGRPHAFASDANGDVCPFCPGNERETPPSIIELDAPWRARVFANKYPPINGAEVIVESPRHEDSFAAIEHAADVVRLYVDRYRAHGDAEYVALFKNEGTRAGASIAHVHSQLIPLPFTPPRIAKEGAAFAASCPMCAPQGDVIAESEHFTWIAPAGSTMAYQQWLVPKRHANEMNGVAADDLARLLQRAAAAMLSIADAFNWAFVNFPRAPRGHWYIDLFPRMTAIAGFELGTGTFVEIIEPAAAARRLRNE